MRLPTPMQCRPSGLPYTADLKDRYSIRVNDQDRITFRWENGHAFEVAAEDCH